MRERGRREGKKKILLKYKKEIHLDLKGSRAKQSSLFSLVVNIDHFKHRRTPRYHSVTSISVQDLDFSLLKYTDDMALISLLCKEDTAGKVCLLIM